MKIHPLAIVSPDAQIGHNVTIGPFAIVESDVVIGDGCRIAAHAVVKDGTRLGPNNRIGEGAVLGGLPQHLRCPQHVGALVVGENNTIREFVTIHRALEEGAATTVGDHNLIMVGGHIAHDCRLGSHIIFANNSLLAGHVEVSDRAFISGAVAVHQFCRIGTLAMVGGHARITQDVPPYVMVDGASGYVVGLNLVGLRRAGLTSEEIAQLKAAYRLIYRRGLKWNEILQQLQGEFADGPAAAFHAFLCGGQRGFVQERRMPPQATLRIRSEVADEQPNGQASAGGANGSRSADAA